MTASEINAAINFDAEVATRTKHSYRSARAEHIRTVGSIGDKVREMH